MSLYKINFFLFGLPEETRNKNGKGMKEAKNSITISNVQENSIFPEEKGLLFDMKK